MSLPEYAMTVPSFPEMYECYLVEPIFQPFAAILLDRAAPGPGDDVIDIACGTGILARLARSRVGAGARVVGVDASPQMLGVARRAAPDVDWREGNAGRLPLGAGERFTVVACHQGLQFFPDKPAALREMRRALAPDGRLAVGTWRSLAEMPELLALNRLAERHLGPITDSRYGFGDAAALDRLLADAGYRDVRLEAVRRPITFADAGPFLRLNAMALVGMSAAGKTMTEDERERVVGAIADESAALLQAQGHGRGFTCELASHLATARG